MAITLGTAYNSGNLANSTGTTLSVTTPTNTKCLVAIITSYDASATDSVANTVTFGGTDLVEARRYRDGSATIMIWYLPVPSITTANLVVTMAGSNTDLQVTALGLISTTASHIVFDNFAESATAATTSHAVVVTPAKTGSMGLGGIVAQTAAVTGLSVTASYGTEITGSEADMGSQVVGCAYRAESGGTCEIRWTKTSSISAALVATFTEVNRISGTSDGTSDVIASGRLIVSISGTIDNISDVTAKFIGKASLSGTVNIAVTNSGVEKLKTKIFGSSDGISTVSGPILGKFKISGSITNISDVTGTGSLWARCKGSIKSGGSALYKQSRYGALYNGYTVDDARGICPAGWHLPSMAELTTLRDAHGSIWDAANLMREEGLLNWTGATNSGSDYLGFSARGNSERAVNGGSTANHDYFTIWCTDNYDATRKYRIGITQSSSIANISYFSKIIGGSIRLIKDDSNDPGFVSDYDGNLYNTVKIGSQVWMKESLYVTHFNNGNAIPFIPNNNGTNNAAWVAAGASAMCYDWYDLAENCAWQINPLVNAVGTLKTQALPLSGSLTIDIGLSGVFTNLQNISGTVLSGCQPVGKTIEFGALYNWLAVVDARGFAPSGYHVPTETDWLTLEANVIPSGETSEDEWDRAQNLCIADSSNKYWTYYGNLGTNIYGFNNKGCGYRAHNTGVFTSLKETSYLMVNTEIDGTKTNVCYLALHQQFEPAGWQYKGGGYGVRLVKDNSTNDGSVTDYDGNVIPTVKIGNQVWTTENWICGHYLNGDPIPNITVDNDWVNTSNGAMSFYGNTQANAFTVNMSDCVTGTLTPILLLFGEINIDLALSGNTQISQPTNLSGSLNIDLNFLGIEISSTSLSGSLNINLTPAASLKSSGNLTGNLNIDLTPTAQLAGKGSLSGAINIDLDPTGSASGKGYLSSSMNIDVDMAGTVAGSGKFTGELNIDVSPSGSLSEKAALLGAINIDLSLSGDANATAPTSLTGEINIDVDFSGSMGIRLPLSGVININVASAGDANLKGNLSGVVDSGCQPLGKTVTNGTLYNYLAASNARGILPAGWRLPTVGEIDALRLYLDPDGTTTVNDAGLYLKESGTTYWSLGNTATNATGFSARGNGLRRFDTGIFQDIRIQGLFWTSSVTTGPPRARCGSMQFGSNVLVRPFSEYPYGLSIRGIKTDSTDPGTVTDNEGNVYPTVKIGTQVWMARDLIVEHYNDGTQIPNVTDNAAWAALSTGALCYYNNDPTNAYYANYTECIQGTLTGKQTLGLSGSINIDVTPSGDATLIYATDLSGAINIDLDLAGDTSGSGQLSGAINIDLALSGDANVADATTLSGVININLDLSGNAKISLPLSGAINIDVTPAGDANLKGNLSGVVDSGCQPLGKTVIWGSLYNWYAAVDARGIAPTGWRVPTEADWDALGAYLGGDSIAGIALKEVSSTYWSNLANSDNSAGFYGRAAGIRRDDTGEFGEIGNNNYIWSSDYFVVSTGTSSRYRKLSAGVATLYGNGTGYDKNRGISIRLIKNDSVNPGTMTDYDGNVYPTVLIGTQVWTTASLIVEHYNDGSEIPNITDNSEWMALTTGGMSYYNNDPSNAYYANYTECITGTLTGIDGTTLSGAINIDVDMTGNILTGTGLFGAINIDVAVEPSTIGSAGSLQGTINIDVDVTADLSSRASLQGNINIDVDVAAQASGTGLLSGTIIIDLDLSADAQADGSLSSSIIIDLNLTGSLSGQGSLSGAINIDLDPSGQPSGSAQTSGAIIIGVDVIGWAIIDSILVGDSNGITITTGTLRGAGLMIGEIIIDVTPEGISRILSLTTGSIYIDLSLPSANLGGYYGMSGQIIISVGIDGVTRLLSALNGLLGIDLDTSGLILGFANIDGILELDVGLSGNPAALYSINGGIFIDLDLDGEITPLAKRRILLIS